ncbi:MAG: hypothetical protein QG604_770 [Candidatus Dependentiae bacterium]|nr:hypothetical protein [Candidatus Dependentiae bacterium]
MPDNVIVTERIVLRHWRESDFEAFFAMNTDPRVMEFLGEPHTREKSKAAFQRMQDHIQAHGFGFWAVGLVDKPESFIGFVGTGHIGFEAHFTPAVEIGWRLLPQYWGHGYATEAAKAALDYTFSKGIAEVVGCTIPANVRSQNVMHKIGMERDFAGDFNHPRVEVGHRLAPHWLYRIKNTGILPR